MGLFYCILIIITRAGRFFRHNIFGLFFRFVCLRRIRHIIFRPYRFSGFLRLRFLRFLFGKIRFYRDISRWCIIISVAISLDICRINTVALLGKCRKILVSKNRIVIQLHRFLESSFRINSKRFIFVNFLHKISPLRHCHIATSSCSIFRQMEKGSSLPTQAPASN